MPTSVMATMPIRIALPTRRAMRMAINRTPTVARITCGSDIFPRPTNVDGFATMMFALRKPTKAMKSPMPAAVPYLRQSGMPFTICSRTFVSVRTRNRSPESRTTAQRRLPGHAAANDDGIREIGVERHPGRQGDRIVGPEAHYQRRESRRNAGGEEHSLDRHARFGKNARVDHHHVGHGHERRQAGQKLAADGGLVFLEVKYAL